MRKTGELIFCGADGLHALADTADFVVVSLSRREIESGLIGDAVDRLMVLSDSAGLTRRMAGRLTVQVTGYDDDPRELYEIPECTRFFRAVTEAWPYWFTFIETQGPTLQVVLCQIANVERVETRDGQIGVRFTDAAIPAIVDRLLLGFHSLHRLHGTSHSEVSARMDAIVAAVNRLLG